MLKKGGRGKQNKEGEQQNLGSGAAGTAAFPISQLLWRAERQGLGAGSPRGEEGARRAHPTYHDCGRGCSCLGGHRGLVGLVLRSFDFGLQVCRRVKIFAFLPHATPLYVIHTNGYGVVIGVDHCAVCGVCKAAVGLSPGTVSSLELPAYLGHRRDESRQCRTEPDGHQTQIRHLCMGSYLRVYVCMCVCACVSFN